jgi:F-type H+-transporting ATPase subunit alpha
LENSIDSLSDRLKKTAGNVQWKDALQSKGFVTRVGDGVAMVKGLQQIAFEELVQFDSGSLGMAYDLNERQCGIVILNHPESVHEGQGVVGLDRLPELSVGDELLGRIVDSLGHPLDEGPAIHTSQRFPLFRATLQLVERKPVNQSLRTGITAIDAAIPIGRGQRELIIGDRNTGKTALVIDIVAAQQKGDVACVYVIIGQPMSRVLTLKDDLEKAGCLQNTVIVAADASSTPGMQYLAPYAGASVAEWFQQQGQDALVVYDDLTKHADAYRELALLLDRPPGREAYPGDIFYVHSELLERAAPRKTELGGGSVTALPLIETSDGDISAYIPTNLISITDGQIFLDATRFEKNLRPAIDIGRSVSRIGSIAQCPAMRYAAKNLRIQISRFESLESLTRVGLEMDTAMRESVERGNLIRQLLRQLRFANRDVFQQVVALVAVREKWLTGIKPERATAFVDRLIARIDNELPEIASKLTSGELPDDSWLSAVKALAMPLNAMFQAEASNVTAEASSGLAARVSPASPLQPANPAQPSTKSVTKSATSVTKSATESDR